MSFMLNGILFATSVESGGFVDMATNVTTIRAGGLTFREGEVADTRFVLVESGPGQSNARRAAEILVDVHKPNRMISAGFAGGLTPSLKFLDIVQPQQIIRHSDGTAIPLAMVSLATVSNTATPNTTLPSPLCTLLTTDFVVATVAEKQRLGKEFAAAIVDMETFAIAEFCQTIGLPMISVRIVLDTQDEPIPEDIADMFSRMGKSTARTVGAVLGTLFRRPKSVFDMTKLQEKSLLAADKLAKHLRDIGYTHNLHLTGEPS